MNRTYGTKKTLKMKKNMTTKPNDFNELSIKDFEQWIKDNREEDPTKKLISGDQLGYICFTNSDTDENVCISVPEAAKSNYIKAFVNDRYLTSIKRQAKQNLKYAYKRAIDCGVNVELTHEWFTDLNFD